MNNKFNKLTLAAAITAAAFAGQAHAGGYQINEQSVSGQGYGHAGRSSNVNDATIVYGNPAGMSFLDRAQISAGGTYLNVNTDIDNASATRNGAPIEGSSEGDMVPGTLIPYIFYAQPVNEQLAFGFGVYAPFGSKTDYEDGFIGRNLGNYTELTVMSAQPTVSYRFNEQWSVGAGVTYNRIDGELRRQVPIQVPGVVDTEFDSVVEGDDDGWGYNLGVIFQPVPETTLGLTYRSKVSYTLTGDFSARATDDVMNPFDGSTIIPAGAQVRSSDASLNLTTPETVNFSVTQQMSDRLKLMAGASWTRWDRFDEIRVDDPSNSGGDPITYEEQNYSNAWAYSVGGEYQLNTQLALRAGVTLDFTPTSDQFRSARIPSDDRRIFSIGAGWTPVDNLTLDLAYSYLTERGTRVDQARNDTSAVDVPNVATFTSDVDATYSADYKNEAHGFGAQLTYRF